MGDLGPALVLTGCALLALSVRMAWVLAMRGVS